jgi:hypothetical protein
MFVDYSGLTVPIINKKTGVKRAETGKEYVGKCRKTDDAL